MRINSAGAGRDYTLFKNVLGAFDPGDIQQVFYDTMGPAHTHVGACLVIFWSGRQYITGDWQVNPILEATFLSDFPSAIKGALDAAY